MTLPLIIDKQFVLFSQCLHSDLHTLSENGNGFLCVNSAQNNYVKGCLCIWSF